MRGGRRSGRQKAGEGWVLGLGGIVVCREHIRERLEEEQVHENTRERDGGLEKVLIETGAGSWGVYIWLFFLLCGKSVEAFLFFFFFLFSVFVFCPPQRLRSAATAATCSRPDGAGSTHCSRRERRSPMRACLAGRG